MHAIYLFHWTHRDNLPSIEQYGISTFYARNSGGQVYACCRLELAWALAHCAKRHGWDQKDMVLLRIKNMPSLQMRLYRDGIYRTPLSIPWGYVSLLDGDEANRLTTS